MPQSSVTPEPIMRLALGFMGAKHLFIANEIGLFRHLASGPATLDALAERAGIPRRTMRISADALVALGWWSETGICARTARQRRPS
jgi:hypothetical protein